MRISGGVAAVAVGTVLGVGLALPALAEQAARDGCPRVAGHLAELAGDELVHFGRFTRR